MKKQLLLNYSKCLVTKLSFRFFAFLLFVLFASQSNFAQTTYTWNGASSSTFEDVNNWTGGTPTFASTSENFTINSVANNPVTNTATILCRIITLGSGVTFTTGANLTSSTNTSVVNGTLTVNAAISNLPKLYIGNSAGVSGVVNVQTGATLTGNNVWRVADNVTATGTININGGTLTLGAAGSMSLGHQNVGILNVNSGIVNINYTSFSSFAINDGKGHVNIDAGRIIIPGDQTAAVQAFITAGKISLSGAALAAGETISNKYDAITDKTTVVASGSLGIHDVKMNTNDLVVYTENQNINVQSVSKILSDVKVYDLKGSLVRSVKNIGLNETSINLNKSNQVYIVIANTTDGEMMTKKIIH